MKKQVLLFFLIASLITCACGNGHKAEKRNDIEIAFNDSVFDFGKVHTDGRKVSHAFTFTNTGSSPLVIQKTVTGCNCLEATYTHKPIPSGGKSSVSVSIDPQQLPKGVFMRTVDVYSNAANGHTVLVINGEVE